MTTKNKTLTEMIETSEPDEWLIEKDTHRAYHVAQSIVNDPRKRLRPLVDRASYDRMKRVAIELAKALEFYADRGEWVTENHPDLIYKRSHKHVIFNDVEDTAIGHVLVPIGGKQARQALSRAKDILGGE